LALSQNRGGLEYNEGWQHFSQFGAHA